YSSIRTPSSLSPCTQWRHYPKSFSFRAFNQECAEKCDFCTWHFFLFRCAGVMGPRNCLCRIGDAVLAPIVKLCGPGGGMGRHLARLLQSAAVLQVGGDAGARKVWLHTSVVMLPPCPPLHHLPGADPVELFPGYECGV